VWLAIFINLLILIVPYILFKFKCFSQSCGTEFLDGLIVPILWLGLISTPVMGLFLFFPEAIFKSWLKRIAWWYSLGLFLVTASTPVLSSNVLSLDRSQIVFGGMILLVIITVPFIYVTHRRLKKVS